MKSKIGIAQLHWDEEGIPRNLNFDDGYFSRGNGLRESEAVYLASNRLPERFSGLAQGAQFVVAETGFGTGLNFLLTWQLFLSAAPASARLRYISVEGYPLTNAQLRLTLQKWTSLALLADRLLQVYPPLLQGHHLLELDQRVELHLLFDEVGAALESLHPKIHPLNWSSPIEKIDAWFLDGFAPAKNYEMWRPEVTRSIARLSKPGTSFATFTAAGQVRRQMQEWGFHVEKMPGYGSKREMLRGDFQGTTLPDKQKINSRISKGHQVWHVQATNENLAKERIAIVGAGIAGLCLAQQLNRLGRECDLYDADHSPATAASGNPQAAIFARISTDGGDLEDWVVSSLSYACRFYQPWWQQGIGQQCGAIQLPRNAEEEGRLRKLAGLQIPDNGFISWLDADALESVTGFKLASAGLWLPQCGWISPSALAANILSSGETQFFGGHSIQVTAADDHRWAINHAGADSAKTYTQVVVCSGHQTIEGLESGLGPITPVSGQLEQVRATPQSNRLQTILCQRSYCTPAWNDLHCLGATYRLREASLDVRAKDSEENLGFLDRMPQLFDSARPQIYESRVGVRATTSDYLPLCGPVPDMIRLQTEFAYLQKDAKRLVDKSCPTLPGLYVMRGFGSRGYTYAPLGAAHLANRICGYRSPLPDHLQRAIHPARFAIRDIIRSRSKKDPLSS